MLLERFYIFFEPRHDDLVPEKKVQTVILDTAWEAWHLSVENKYDGAAAIEELSQGCGASRLSERYRGEPPK